MPSEKVLLKKQKLVQDLVEKLKGSSSIVLVDYKGINVENDTKMRAELRAEGVDYTVVKNSLLNFACKDAGFEEFIPALAGTTAVALSEDEVAPARILQKYAAKNKAVFNFKMGYISGKFMDAEELKAIASLPSREGMVAQLAGSLNSIIASLARGLSEVAKKMEDAA
jgi:large subunit ribosomal protein L10